MEPNKLVPELTVFDFERAVQFYVEILGFRISYKRDGPRFVYLEYESAQIMLEESHASAWKTAELSPPLGRGVNFQIEVLDVSPILDRLAKAKYSLYRELRDVWYQTAVGVEGQREFLVQDPDGYLLRFAQYLETRAKAA
jgi:catechol 2,3-dioxygenase-like lactoylglutathione lyase family enzyme